MLPLGAVALATSLAFPTPICGGNACALRALQAQTDPRHQRDLDSDTEIGKKYSAQIEEQLKLSEDQEVIVRVQRIGGELAAIANSTPVEATWGDKRLNPFQYTFKVVKNDDVNAFSIPGGFIYVYEGLVKFAETDAELAGVMAHEIAHASLRHIAALRREQSKIDLLTLPLLVAAILAGGSDGAKIAQGSALAGQAFVSGWSVKAEYAADFAGMQYMLKSKYNPVGSLTFMERLAYKQRLEPRIEWGIYETHPPSEERARFLTGKLRERQIPIRRSQVTTSLRAEVRPGENSTVELWFGPTKLHNFRGSKALERADAAVARVNSFFDSIPALYELGLRNDAAITGRDRVLFEIEPEDTPGSNGVTEAAESALQALRKAVFDLSYRLWPEVDRATSRARA